MFINYTLKSSLWHPSVLSVRHDGLKAKPTSFVSVVLMLLFAVTGIQAQTTRIGNSIGGSSVADGTFSTGSTFAANGWTVANEGSGQIKWALGNAVSDTSPSTTSTVATLPAVSYSVTLPAVNTNIAIGQLVTGTNIAANTYVSNISGTTLLLTQPTTNGAAASNITLTFGALAANISGRSAYVSNDNGVTNAAQGFGARTVFFYTDVPTTVGQTNMMLKFDWKSGANTWQVFAVPTSYIPVGTDAQTTLPIVLTGATPIVLSNTNTTTQTATGFIPPSFATGTSFRLVFVWSNSIGGGTNPPLAIDNISLVSRAGGQTLNSAKTGLLTEASTWSEGYVPSPADDIVVNANHLITIDGRVNFGAENVFVAGTNARIQFGFFSDQFTINNDLGISGSGAQFNVFEPIGVTTTPNGNGKLLKVGHDISYTSAGRLDVTFGNTSAGFGELVLNGTTLQTISTDGSSFLGGTSKLNTSSNTFGIINQLTVTNTSTATPNINWQLNNVRIKSKLTLTSGRIALGSNKIILGNFGALGTNLACNLGTGFIGGTVSKWYTTSATGAAIDAGIDYNPNGTALYPFLSATGQNRWAYLISSAATVAGELAVTYTDATTMSIASIVDGITVGSRYDGSWSVATPDSRIDNTLSTAPLFTYTSSTNAYSLGLYATGAFAPNDGNSRIVYASGPLAGAHINGTTTPFIARSGLTLANITAGPLYVGAATTSIQPATTRTSVVASGDWNTPATWSPSGVPACGDVVTIAAGHTITVSATPATGVAGITINAGGTLVNAGGTLTVGCTNNNAIFTNFGTNTVSGGTLVVNGAVYHKLGSTFNHTSGDVIIDSNNAGDASTSVGQGGSSLKLDTSNLNLTGGKITIVDPLINNVISTTATSATSYTMTTIAGTFAKPTTGDAASGTTVISMAGLNRANTFSVGQYVTGAGIAAGTRITNVNVPLFINAAITLTLDTPTTALIPTGTSLNFSAMSNDAKGINFPTSTANWQNIAVGQLVSGNGIPAGTTVTETASGFGDSAFTVFLSNPVTGLTTSPITAAETITFSAASPNCSTIILPAANSLISVGQAVSGTGIAAGTTVSVITTVGSQVRLDLSLPTTGAMVAPVALSFYAGNLNSYAFAYNAPVNYVSGLNHTLQIGNSTSTDKGAVTTNGFLCNFIQGGGTFSLGNLTIDAPQDGANRFFNVVNILNVQNAFTITAGSVFKKTNFTGGMFFGGNVTNNGSFFMVNNAATTFGNAVTGFTTLPQTISGSGNFYNNLTVATATGSLTNLTVNNTSTSGVTISFPNFRLTGSLTMNNGIVHTSATYPLYHGAADLSSNPNVSGALSNTAHIDGPYARSFSATSLSTNFGNFPVGKNGVYMPIGLAVANGGYFMAEAFTTNTGSTTINATNLSAQRWKAERVGTAGTFTNFNVSLGSSSIAANNIVVQASTDQGTYDNVFGNTVTYTAGTPNVIATTTPLVGTSFTGFFAYANQANCTSVNPGNTLADFSITQIRAIQNCASSNGIVSGSVNVTLNASNGLITSGLLVSGAGIQSGTTVVSISGTALVLSLPATISSTTQTELKFFTFENPSSVCGPIQVSLSLQNPSIGGGVTYQWQSSPDSNVNNYTNISGATAATYVAVPTATTYYRCNVTCVSGPVTVASTGVQITISNSAAIGTTTAGITCTPSTPVTVSATATTGTLAWYAAATGGSPLALTPTYTSSPATTTTYYVAAETTTTYTSGRTLSGTASAGNNFTGIVLNVSKNVRLNSVKLHPRQVAGGDGAGAPITIKLFKDGVQVPGTDAVTFTPATNTSTISAAISNVVNLNYDIPAGNGYKLLVTSGLNANNLLARVATGSIVTPVGTGSVSVTLGASNFDATSNQEYNNFFDLNISDLCATPRVPVVANVGGCPQVDLKLFIEGYYAGGGLMTPVKANQGVGVSTTLVDDVTVELRSATAPYALVATSTAALQTNGNASATMKALPGSYYIAVKHRNALETWSATTQTVGAVPLSYDFTTAANKAFGDNMKDLGGVFGFYSGDINQDGFIEGGDFPFLFNDSDNFFEGFQTTDLNGDGFVEGADFPYLFNNSDNFIESLRPF
ncbi:beta strand repeat-containing protein [Flavobacterium sp. RSB2_4_14]|uniref:beta strand repeat-containing protein n=1 Tax=Flavobacterium sp. RSB2_4_14 TaxID=3447665 RepID=UPI003F3F3745